MDELNQKQHGLLTFGGDGLVLAGLKQCAQAFCLSVACLAMSMVQAADSDQQLDNVAEMEGRDLAEGVVEAAREAARQVENLLQEVNLLRHGIAAQVAEDGNTWHVGIAESQLALGVALQSLDDHPAAITELERAVHINRVNHGLFALQQIPALLLQVRSHLAMEDWQAADERMQYAFYVHTQALADNEAEMIPALVDYAHWQLSSYADGHGAIPSVRLVDAYQLLRVADSIIDRHPTPEAYPRASYLRQMAYIAWLIQHSDLDMWLDADKLDARVVEDAWVINMTDENYVSQRSPYLMGESALEEIVALRKAQFEATDEDSPDYRQSLLLYSEAIKQHADWNLVFERRYEAMDLYQRSWQLMAAHSGAAPEEGFQDVLMLPLFRSDDIVKGHNETGLTVPGYTRAFLNEDVLSILSSGRAARRVTLEFEINRFGRPTQVEVVEVAPEDDQDLRRQVVSLVQSRKFRPWIVDGEAQDSELLTKSFSFGMD
ncbi:hypothetical protein [Pseudohongiella nitratireducens]|uniref:energy transducer TonB n=1 Tax=Pseudohongiella nitratireducens TaxID=1768907 RepID=UPI0030EC178D|tara:strand:+ start:9874 stop:11343 length:1470 start_codon:yes stop_codon:yes gene_type:complete